MLPQGLMNCVIVEEEVVVGVYGEEHDLFKA